MRRPLPAVDCLLESTVRSSATALSQLFAAYVSVPLPPRQLYDEPFAGASSPEIGAAGACHRRYGGARTMCARITGDVSCPVDQQKITPSASTSRATGTSTAARNGPKPPIRTSVVTTGGRPVRSIHATVSHGSHVRTNVRETNVEKRCRRTKELIGDTGRSREMFLCRRNKSMTSIAPPRNSVSSCGVSPVRD